MPNPAEIQLFSNFQVICSVHLFDEQFLRKKAPEQRSVRIFLDIFNRFLNKIFLSFQIFDSVPHRPQCIKCWPPKKRFCTESVISAES